MRLAFVWDFVKENHCDWFEKEDGMQASIHSFANHHSVALFSLTPSDEAFSITRHGVAYNFYPDIDSLLKGIAGFDPDVIQMNGFNRPVNDRIIDLFSHTAKTIYYHGGPLKEKNIDNVDQLVVAHEIQAKTLGSLKTAVIPHTVDPYYFMPMKHVDKTFDIISVGSFVHIKRHELLINALAQLRARAIIVGKIVSEEYYNRCVSLADKLGVRERVDIVPDVSPARLANYYRQSRILCHTSSTEAGPRVVLEAMSSGLPCVVCGDDIYGARNFVTPGVNGAICDAEPFALAETIEGILNNGRALDAMGDASREYVTANHTHKHMFDKMNALFMSLTNAGGDFSQFESQRA